jgi:hypothetical protein
VWPADGRIHLGVLAKDAGVSSRLAAQLHVRPLRLPSGALFEIAVSNQAGRAPNTGTEGEILARSSE